MRKLFVGFATVVFSLVAVYDIYAGGLSTPGQGTRALGMGGAFTAVADDGSNIYYNPAGMTQISGSLIEEHSFFAFPEIKYKMPDGTSEKSAKNDIGQALFLENNFNNGLSAGLGIYIPYASTASFGDDMANVFPAQSAKMVRVDISPVIAYKVSDNISVGVGAIAGYGLLEQSMPVFIDWPGIGALAGRVDDKADGWGYGGLAGILWTINKNVKLGATYRTAMDIDAKGHRTIDITSVFFSATDTADASTELRFPASISLGMAIMPDEKLTISAQVDWANWSRMSTVVTKTSLWPDDVVIVNARDSWDFRLGGEYLLDQGWVARAGYGYMQQAFPTSTMTPVYPDGNGHAFNVGAGKSWNHWKLDLNYQYYFTKKTTTDENIFGYNGEYSITDHLIALQIGYKW